MTGLRWLMMAPLVMVWDNRRDVAAIASFIAITVGFWLAWYPLGLIIPGTIAFAALSYTRVSGKDSIHDQQPKDVA